MAGMDTIYVKQVSLFSVCEKPRQKSDFLFASWSANEKGHWCLADYKTPAEEISFSPPEKVSSWIAMSGLENIVQDYQLPTNQVLTAIDPFSIDIRLNDLHSEINRTSRTQHKCIQLSVCLLLLECLRQSMQCTSAVLNTKERFDQVIRQMLTEYAYPWQVSELSEKLNVSPSYFNKLCRRYYGQSPIDMLIDRRIAIAKNYLHLPDSKIGEVCEMVGFNDICYFSRIFKKRSGLTPNQYMKKIPLINQVSNKIF